jgi:glycosyltransferase involved in cell wall biosynthesis
MTRTMFECFYPASIGKVYPTVVSFAEWIADAAAAWRHLALPFGERDIDVIFVASDWDRVEKNYTMVKAIARRLGDLRVHVVGDVPDAVPSATHHGFVASREALFGLLGRARTIACPSLIDAAPGILFEGSVMGCNLVASKNCGNWQICDSTLVADPGDTAGFARAIRSAARRKHDDQLEVLRQRGGYRELMAVIAAAAQPFEAEPA